MPDAFPDLELTVVMPCLNEALTLAGCINEASKAMRTAGIVGEVVIADNGSTDGSQAIATNAGARVVPVAEKGYGHALRGGIAAARGRFIVMGDADGSYDFSHLPRFVAELRAGNDLVMGNRFLGGVLPGAMPWKNRYLGNPALSFIGRLFFPTRIGDFHCGLRGFSAAAYQRMNLRTTGMEFASELVIKSVVLGLRVTEVPTVLRPDGRNRPPHLRPWRDGWRHLRFMLLFSPRWLFLYPGLLLIAGGLIATFALLPGPVAIGRIHFDVHTLLFATLAVLIGFQAVSFAALSKFFAIRAGLRPPEEKFDTWIRQTTLESGLTSGALLFVAGLLLWASAVWVWGEHGFGPLQPAQTLRWVIPGALCLALGCQLVLTSFFLGVLRLDTRTDLP
ncbi:MAG TPA: glycosyltransferase family 2 protein [Lacunisphaera sp.]|jgi:glycosyltransferase involved in cell wall biosynthesis